MMKKTILFFFILAVIIICVCGQGKRIKCHPKGFEDCFKHFFGIGKRSDATKLATTAEGLNKFCGAFNKTIECVHGYLNQCALPLHRELWDLFTGDLQYNFRNGLCIDGPIKREYLNRSQCIYDHVLGADDAIPCLNNYLLAFEHLSTDEPHDFIATLCCAHMRKEKCTDTLARQHCGSETEEIFRIFFDKIHFGFFSTFCWKNKDFQVDSELCRVEFPNAGTEPKGLKSQSSISKLLYKNFPFNYVPKSRRYKKKSKKGKGKGKRKRN